MEIEPIQHPTFKAKTANGESCLQLANHLQIPLFLSEAVYESYFEQIEEDSTCRHKQVMRVLAGIEYVSSCLLSERGYVPDDTVRFQVDLFSGGLDDEKLACLSARQMRCISTEEAEKLLVVPVRRMPPMGILGLRVDLDF